MRRVTVATCAAVLVLAACSQNGSSGDGGSPSGSAPFELDAAPVRTTEVTAVKSYRFEPQVIQVAAGSEVTWSNEDDFPHNVHFLTGRDDTYDLPIGERATVRFDEPGEYYYECSIHPQQMRGEVIVSG